MAATLSLEPLFHALPLFSASSDKGEPDTADNANPPEQQTLAARLHRLWQERGDFSQLSTEELQSCSESEEGVKEEAVVEASNADQGASNGQDHSEKEQKEDSEEESMTQEQLWDLKLGILQGLDLARSDITSALDLLQLLLNPLNALSPAVPEEALALPSGSMSSTCLHTPLAPPAEGIHLRNTALAFATKTKAVDTASSLLRNASKRLDRTTNKSQSEWTDLLRLKRSGQWKIEARPAQVPAKSGPSSVPFVPNIPLDRMAKDLCIFCGIEESAYRWRQAGLVRLNSNAVTERDKGKQKLNVPERLEGRRRMCVRVSMFGVTPEESKYSPVVGVPHEEDIHSALSQVQQELFEEEIFAELIREAREQPFGIIATRKSLEIQHDALFKLTISMEDIEDLTVPHSKADSPSSQTGILAQTLNLLARLQMVQIYRNRRRAKSDLAGRINSKDAPINISNALRQLLLYYRHSLKLEELLTTCVEALRKIEIFGSNVELDFSRCLSSPDTVIASIISGKLNLQGCATLTMAAQPMHLTFGGPSAIVLHLPTRNLVLRNIEHFVTILKRILQVALLKELENTLKSVIADTSDSSHWEVIPTPKVVGKGTPAFAHKKAKIAAERAEVEAFISILPSVAIKSNLIFEVEIAVEAQVSARVSQSTTRKKLFQYTSNGQNDQNDDALPGWLRNAVYQL